MANSLFTWFRWLASTCFFVGHDHPIKVLNGSTLHFECWRCGADLGVVLKGQKFTARQPSGRYAWSR